MLSSINTLVTGFTLVTKYISMAANVIGTLVVLGLVVIVNFDVVARGVFNQPFRGAVEVVQFSIVLIVFLQLPDVIRVNRLTASDGFLILMGKRYPRFIRGLRIAINAVAAIFMCLVAVTMYPEFIEMWETKDFFGIPGVFTAPWWPIKLVITLSAGLCAILFTLKILDPANDVQVISKPDEAV